MRKLSVFNLVTLDGYFAGEGGDISWHMVDDEFQELANTAANGGNTLIFGRVTYELMASYWPTPEALRDDPLIAKGMNAAEKIVFSRTLDKVDWHNTRLVNSDLIGEIKRLKAGAGPGLTLLGSGSLVAQLAAAGLIDEYQILLNPVVLGQGRSMFAGVAKRFNLKLLSSRVFGNGNVLLIYEPIRSGGV
ncbi:MAG: dihydrofolate reductase [Desulfobulbaceae bacterium]|nr:dihydrofolate reductase [Desulfobulbaceae bacterium]